MSRSVLFNIVPTSHVWLFKPNWKQINWKIHFLNCTSYVSSFNDSTVPCGRWLVYWRTLFFLDKERHTKVLRGSAALECTLHALLVIITQGRETDKMNEQKKTFRERECSPDRQTGTELETVTASNVLALKSRLQGISQAGRAASTSATSQFAQDMRWCFIGYTWTSLHGPWS